MMRRFCSGSVTPASSREEPVGRLDVDERHVEVLLERLDHLLGLGHPQEAVVDEDARELVADGAVDEERRDGGVDAARERADDVLVADLLADQLDLLLDELERRPRGRRLAGVEHEVAEDVGAARRVGHLGVELDGVEAAVAILHPGDGGGVGRGRHAEPGRRADDAVAMAHPGRLRGRQVAEEQAPLAQRDGRLPELADAGVRHLAAEGGRHRLHPVADAEHGDAEVEDARVDRRGARLVDRRRAAGEDDPDRVAGGELGRRRVVRHDLGVDPALAHAPGDELGVLGAEVDDQDRPVPRARLVGDRRGVAAGARVGAHRLIPIACSRWSFLPSV